MIIPNYPRQTEKCPQGSPGRGEGTTGHRPAPGDRPHNGDGQTQPSHPGPVGAVQAPYTPDDSHEQDNSANDGGNGEDHRQTVHALN